MPDLAERRIQRPLVNGVLAHQPGQCARSGEEDVIRDVPGLGDDRPEAYAREDIGVIPLTRPQRLAGPVRSDRCPRTLGV